MSNKEEVDLKVVREEHPYGMIHAPLDCASADGPCATLQLADAVERYREALEEIDRMTSMAEDMNEYGMIHQAGEVARAALHPEPADEEN